MAPPGPEGPPALMPGTELMGQMEDSGFEETPYLVQRADGKAIQLPAILYALAERIDGQATYEQIAAAVSEAVGAGIEPDDARFLVVEKLAPLGLIDGTEAVAAHEQREAERAEDPKPGEDLLALTWKAKVISERASERITAIFAPLFHAPIVAAVVAGFVAVVGWLFFVHGITQAVRAIIYDPALLVMVFAGVIIATAFHETGHASACRYGGAKPGVMGIGLYVIWPVFYTDVTSAYSLDRRGRLRTDLGGIYFNAIFAIVCTGIYAVTSWEPILVLVMTQTFTIAQQLLPLGRLDGYLILTDLTGVPDLLGRMKPLLRSAVPGNEPEAEVEGLKPWVRRVATGYIFLLIPVLGLILVLMIMHAPRVFATAYDSFGVRWDKMTTAFDGGHVGTGLGDVFQLLALVLPGLGMIVSTGRIGKRAGGGALKWSAGNPFRRTLVVTAGTAAVALAAVTWWPNGDYRPIQPGERGTIQGGIQSLSAVTTGRPSLTRQRAEQLHGAPFEHKAKAAKNGTSDDQTTGGKSTRDSNSSGTETTPATTGTSTTPSSSAPATGTSTSPSSAPAATTETQTTPAPAATTPTETTPTTTTPTETQTTPTTTTPTETSTTPTTTDTTSTTTP